MQWFNQRLWYEEEEERLPLRLKQEYHSRLYSIDLHETRDEVLEMLGFYDESMSTFQINMLI